MLYLMGVLSAALIVAVVGMAILYTRILPADDIR
jgi:hypothetical protein